MLLAYLGGRIGERLGWAEERTAAVRALGLALAESWSAIPDLHGHMSYSCDGVRASLARLGRMAAVGEPQATRDWIAASGKSLESFVLRAREESRRAAAASAAAATSTASAPRSGT
jgi:hypothetical protein